MSKSKLCKCGAAIDSKVKYCDDCRKAAIKVARSAANAKYKERLMAEKRQNEVLTKAIKNENACSLSAFMKELDAENAKRRAKGEDIISYGKFVANCK